MAQKKHIREDCNKQLSADDINVTVVRRAMDGTVTLCGYKSAVILAITNEGPCRCSTIRAKVWLRGNDFDNLIKALRKARRAWKANKG